MGRRRRKAVSKPEGESGSKRSRTSAPNPKKEDENVKDTKGKSTGGGNAAEISKPEAEASGSAVHPLLIPHILEKVFQHIICSKTAVASPWSTEAESSALVSKNVQNLRLVCKQWKDTATRVFRRNRALMSFGSELGAHPSSSENAKMQKFLDVMKSSDLIPVQRYKLKAGFFVNENQQLMKDFMCICGPDAVELSLGWDNACTMKFSRRTFPDLNLMGLKTLEFHCRHFTYFGPQVPKYEIAYLIEVLFSAAEKLETFEFGVFPQTSGGPSNGGKWSQVMIKLFGECIPKHIPKSVKIFHLEMPMSELNLFLNTLSESELKLEEFRLGFNAEYGSANIKLIRKFFEKQAATLKVLKIFDRVYGNPTLLLDFPRFDQLLHLDLKLWRSTIQSFSFPETFPKLTTLNISELKTESTCVEFLNCCTKKGMSLKEIHLPGRSYHHENIRIAQAPFVKKAAQFFPNISKLHISPSHDIQETLQEVFVHFDNIEELYIDFPYTYELSADSILSGVSPLDCQEIMEHRNFDMNIDNFQGRPSILNLTKLKKLVLEHPLYNIVLTDFSVRFIFLKMASLKELHTDQCEMSNECVDLLRENLSLNLTPPYYQP